MSKLPLRLVGVVALSIAVTIASCSAFLKSVTGPDRTPAAEQPDGRVR